MRKLLSKHQFNKFISMFSRWKNNDPFTWDDYGLIVKKSDPIETKGIGKSNLQHIFGEGDSSRLTIDMISKICKLLKKDFQKVCSECGIDTSINSDEFISRNRMILEQANLQEGDEVWIIGSSRFLESSDEDIRSMVVNRLKAGVIYKYFYPLPPNHSQLPHPYGDESVESFNNFVDTHLSVMKLKHIPRAIGFGLDPSRFAYFSKLHILVYHICKSSSPTFKRMYAYMPHLTPDYPHEEAYEWCPLPIHISNEIHSDISSALSTSANFSPHKIQTPIPNVKLVKRYRDFYHDCLNLKIYDDFKKLIDFEQKFIENIKEIGEELEASGIESPKVLDIGCGDGTLSNKMLTQLCKSSLHPTMTLLDSSSEQLNRAKAHHWDGYGVAYEEMLFESLPITDRSFDLITSIHSFYAIAPAYVHNVYSLLAPGGIAFIWIASGEKNLAAKISETLDLLKSEDQKRTDAEDIIRMCSWLFIKERCRFEVKEIRNNIRDADKLLSDTQDFRTFASFCALKSMNGNPSSDLEELEIVRTIIDDHLTCCKQSGATPHTLDVLITFRKPTATM